MLKPTKVSTFGKPANVRIAAKTAAKADAGHEAHSNGVGRVSFRCEDGDQNGGKRDRRGAVGPCGHDPEEFNGPDGHERAARVDKSWQAIGYSKPCAAASRATIIGLVVRRTEPTRLKPDLQIGQIADFHARAHEDLKIL